MLEVPKRGDHFLQPDYTANWFQNSAPSSGFLYNEGLSVCVLTNNQGDDHLRGDPPDYA
jgi:hypothetical protein